MKRFTLFVITENFVKFLVVVKFAKKAPCTIKQENVFTEIPELEHSTFVNLCLSSTFSV